MAKWHSTGKNCVWLSKVFHAFCFLFIKLYFYIHYADVYNTSLELPPPKKKKTKKKQNKTKQVQVSNSNVIGTLLVKMLLHVKTFI